MSFEQFKTTGSTVNLKNFQTKFNDNLSNDEIKDRCKDLWQEIKYLQETLYAESKQSLLIVLQAMDAAGKDSTIEKLTINLNAQGCRIKSFKSPSKLELSHDFLWRVHQATPKKGEIMIFNRSHYEDVLIVKVHGWADKDIIEKRYDHINNFEALLTESGTRVVKFLLNISPEFQLSRFKNRLENTEKNWKFNPADLEERKYWGDYMQAFEIALEKCASEESPWYIVPAENRKFRDLMIATIIRDTLLDMNPQYPSPDFDIEDYSPDLLV